MSVFGCVGCPCVSIKCGRLKANMAVVAGSVGASLLVRAWRASMVLKALVRWVSMFLQSFVSRGFLPFSSLPSPAPFLLQIRCPQLLPSA